MILLSLDEWWHALSGAQHIFWFIAGVSSLLFIILFGLSLFGVDSDADADTDFDLDADHETGHDYSLDKDFSAFSVRSIVSFLTFFGWTGVYLLSAGKSVFVAILAATITGGIAMFIVAYMIYKFSQLEKSTTMNVYNALDRVGEVYLTIPQPGSGQGKVHLVVDGSLHEFEATTKGEALPTGSSVRVIDILDNQILLVEPAPREIN